MHLVPDRWPEESGDTVDGLPAPNLQLLATYRVVGGELSNPAASKPRRIWFNRMNRFQTLSVRAFSSMMRMGPWSMPMTSGPHQLAFKLKASRKP